MEGGGTLPKNSNKPFQNLWEATLWRRTFSVRLLAKSFGTDRQIDRNPDRQIDRQTDRQTDGITDRKTDKETGKHTTIQTDTQIDKQTSC